MQTSESHFRVLIPGSASFRVRANPTGKPQISNWSRTVRLGEAPPLSGDVIAPGPPPPFPITPIATLVGFGVTSGSGQGGGGGGGTRVTPDATTHPLTPCRLRALCCRKEARDCHGRCTGRAGGGAGGAGDTVALPEVTSWGQGPGCVTPQKAGTAA